MKKALILGANSDIAEALIRELSEKEEMSFVLMSRNREHLDLLARDLQVRFRNQVETETFDAEDRASWGSLTELREGEFDLLVVAFGYLGDQVEAEEDLEERQRILTINYEAAVQLTELCLSKLAAGSTIIGISSVAGVRGRSSNYFYGSAKAGFNTYLSGLRARLDSRPIRVLTVLAGFVGTKMTAHLDLPPLLVAKPERVAAGIYRAYRRGRNVIYVPFFWRWIMLVLRLLPEPIFKRLA